MGRYIECGFGAVSFGNDYDLGFNSATQALSQINKFLPSLAIAFISSACNVKKVHQGLVDALEDCPLIGTTTAGEILDDSLENTVVVTVMASPYLKAHIGFGKNVANDYVTCVQDALESAEIEEYFSRHSFLNQMLNLTAPGNPSPPMFMVLFTPGATRSHISRSHEIHTEIRKRSGNRVPIIGGSSADYFRYEKNYQIANHEINQDSIALALIESELLFGMGMSHGFKRTDRQTIVTKAQGHYVHELDKKPAAKVMSQLLEIPFEKFKQSQVPLTNFPFGVNDVYGNSLLMVPEMITRNGSIQFAPIMRNNQMLTLMKEDKKFMNGSCLRAFHKAIDQGGLQKPEFSMLFACGLRKKLNRPEEPSEIDILKSETEVPLAGFYTFGEFGLSDDGFPIYSNQSVSMMVLSDELNPVTDLIHRRKKIYSEYHLELQKKIGQIQAINAIGKLITECNSYDSLLPILVNEMKELLPWAESAFYLTTNMNSEYFSIASSSNFEVFPDKSTGRDFEKDAVQVWLKSDIKNFGFLVAKPKKGLSVKTDDELLMVNIIGQITSGALHKIDINKRLENKLQQIEILNQFGGKLAKSMETNEKYEGIIKNIRTILEIDMVSLWFTEPNQNIIINEAVDVSEDLTVGEIETRTDNRISKWQIENKKPIFSIKGARNQCPVSVDDVFDMNFVSLPIMYKEDTLQGVLNIYSKQNYKWYFQLNTMEENIEFLSGFSGMLAIFIENRALYQHKTFNMEIHHRVKNNLQTIASLLTMQARRIEGDATKTAFSDSISRVMSIAKVHEMLSLKEVESVELGDLVTNISNLAQSEVAQKPVITLELNNSELLLPSKTATSLALVLNELIQNAVKHSLINKAGSAVRIKTRLKDNSVQICVQDNGPGLDSSFDISKHKNLGLTIVSTIASGELKGSFKLASEKGTKAILVFPVPVIQRLKK